MGGQMSKMLQNHGNLEDRADDLSSHDIECGIDSDLQNFDQTLQDNTTRVINIIAAGIEVRALSFDSLKEVIGCLLEMNQEVDKIVFNCKKDILKNPELCELVQVYFENSLQTLDICTALEKFLKGVRDSQLIINVALQLFEEEEKEGEVNGEKYLRTLEELRNFKAAGDPFTEEFFEIFKLVYEQQVSMLEKLRIQESKLDKKLQSKKLWRKLSSIFFVVAFAALLICSVVAEVKAAPPVATALAAAALSIPVGKWVDALWKKYEDAIKGQKEVISSMKVGTYIVIEDLKTIRILVNKLEIEIESLMKNSDFALTEEEAVKIGIEEIKKMLGVFTKSIEDLGNYADKCSEDIRNSRKVILRKIIKLPND